MRRGRSTKEGRALIRQAEEYARHFTASATPPRRKTELAVALIPIFAVLAALTFCILYAYIL